jgi:CRP/FNR family cyclic AMP-dependent transcriptional regulator
MSAVPAQHPTTEPATPRVAPLLDLDPDLGQFLGPERFAQAHRRLLARVERLPAGQWDADAVRVDDTRHLGFLLLDGIIARDLLLADVVSTELLGAGEIVRPWQLGDDGSLVRADTRWTVLAPARLAVLDGNVAARLAEFPELMSQLVERMNARSRRLALTQAISQQNRVDRRLLDLLWHLAERWGRVTPDGVALPLTLSHRMLSHLIGARRPSVTTALAELSRSGEIQRGEDGGWILRGAAPRRREARITRFVAPRRRFMTECR